MRTLLLLVCLGACTVGDIGSSGGGDDDGSGDPAAVAHKAFTDNVLPLVTTNCGGCHTSPSDGNGWMQGEAYASMKMWPHLVEVGNPTSSLLLTKGQHLGPMWKPEQQSPILDWIQLERDAQGGTTGPEVDAIDIADGPNTIMLDKAGAAGSTLTFTAQHLQLGLYLSNIAVSAGTGGVHLTHPLFVTWSNDMPSPDPVDSFDSVDMDVAQAMSGSVGGGLLLLEDIPSGARLSVSFRKVGPSTGGGTTLPGCKAVAAFTTNAKGPLGTSCVSCHGGTDSGATNATDMRKVNDTTTDGQTTACGQILGRTNLMTPAQSGIFLAPDPASGTSHPFKFAAGAFTTFKTSVSVWVQAEKTAAGL